MLVSKYRISYDNTGTIKAQTEWITQINDLDDTKDIIEQVMKDYLQVQKMKDTHMYLITKDTDGDLSFFEIILKDTAISIRDIIQKMLSIDATNLTVVFNKDIIIQHSNKLKLICKTLNISFNTIKFITE